MIPSFSIIVPTLNEAKYLPRLLDSIRRQTIGGAEVLIGDSGSEDGTQSLAEAAGARVLAGERKGPGEGRNRGAKASRGDVLLFADADCILPPDLLEAVVRALEDPRVIGGATRFMPEEGTALDRLLFELANVYQRAMTEIGVPHNAGYCFFFRRAAFERLGGMDERMLLNETHDLALRSRALGRFVVLPSTVTTSMRRFRTYGYAHTILREYVASTIMYYATGRTPPEKFRPKPAR
jgi:glycosyltransferase involved in cell wall biosynthesis